MKTERNYEVTAGAAVPVKMWTRGVEVEEAAMVQLRNVASLPFVHRHVAVMPDVHWGRGATIGSVIPTRGAIIPAAVGVDLGCGMMAVRTSLVASDLPDSLLALRSAIEAAVPHGRTANGGPGDKGAWPEPPDDVAEVWQSFAPLFETMTRKHPKLGSCNTFNHLGTLGSGNHFIELVLDEAQAVWVMLHSGSRGVGNRIGSYFIELAKNDMRRWFINLPDADLSYLPEGTEHFHDYTEALGWAQQFAFANREVMMRKVLGAMALEFGKHVCVDQHPLEGSDPSMVVNCHHNYVARETHFGDTVWVTRKGAVRARAGDYGIIPGAMGARSFIVRGKGNAESFHSCSHGAGRRMSRNEAKKRFTLDDHAKATAGVECRKDAGVLDETRDAYKSIEAVMAAQADLVEIVHTFTPLLCVKG